MNKLLTTLLAEYEAKPYDESFSEKAKTTITTYKPKRNVPTDLIDPERIRSNASYLSKLKWQCYSKPVWQPGYEAELAKIRAKYPDDDVWMSWDETKTPADQIKQKGWRSEKDNVKAELLELKVAPTHLRRLGLSEPEKKRVQTITETQKRKVMDVAIKLNADELITKIMPGLKATEFKDVMMALLLATGRREVEILKTGEFKKISSYRVAFKGHAKSHVTESYDIDLLAPADDVIDALAWMRANVDCTAMSNVQVNSRYAALINRAVGRATKLGHAHQLRGINAVACWHLWGGKKSLIGYLRGQLGHASDGASTGYSSWTIAVTKPWGGDDWKDVVEVKEKVKPEMKSYSKPSALKLTQILAMMDDSLEVTTRSIIKLHGGSPALVGKLVEMNRTAIDTYNKSLT